MLTIECEKQEDGSTEYTVTHTQATSGAVQLLGGPETEQVVKKTTSITETRMYVERLLMKAEAQTLLG